MKYRIFYLLALCVASMAMTACSEDEDLTPSYKDVNGFEPAADDNSATAQLRRDFFKETGSYLLFDDKLTTSSTNGQPELIEPGWSMIGSSSNNYQYQYITNIDEQREAVALIKQYLLPRFNFKMFSYLLVNELYYINYYGRKNVSTNYFGARTLVISMSLGEAYDAPEEYFSSMMIDIIKGKLDYESPLLKPFYAYSEQYYGYDYEDFGWDDKPSQEELWELGFTGGNSYYFYYKNKDYTTWLELVLSNTEEEFEEQYGDYPVMMAKYRTLKEIIEQQGFVLK